jgi:hypothetical protein
MFLVTEADASAIRDTFEQAGEVAAAVELRRRFPLLTNNANALEWARTIASWRPVPAATPPRRCGHALGRACRDRKRGKF